MPFPTKYLYNEVAIFIIVSKTKGTKGARLKASIIPSAHAGCIKSPQKTATKNTRLACENIDNLNDFGLFILSFLFLYIELYHN